MATRMRSRDMIKIAKAISVLGKDLFSLEMRGGATLDVAYRFLRKSPWERLEELRRRMPNSCQYHTGHHIVSLPVPYISLGLVSIYLQFVPWKV